MDAEPDDQVAGPSNPSSAANSADQDSGAPRYRIAPKQLSAVEIPAVVENVDRAVKAFGRVPTLAHVLDPTRNSIPLYLCPEDPFCKPLMSHSSASHNVVLKVTVPRRTGRRRKKGSDGPWEGDVDIPDASATDGRMNGGQVQSVARLDEPGVLRRKLADNVGNYNVEAVGIIKRTHRFRALADFCWDMNRSDFAQRFAQQVLPGDVQNLKKFAFGAGTDGPPNVDVLPPPIFTHMSLPFNYFYSQNPYVRTTEDGDTFNLTAVKQVGHFIGAEDPAPSGPLIAPDMTDPRMVQVISHLQEAFLFRPIWTRRSLMNHLQDKLQSWNELKRYLNYTAYQFKGGPWRDSVVPYGIDPRSDPRYRIYQTLMFKLKKHKGTMKEDQPWQSEQIQRNSTGASHATPEVAPHSHMFDGETYSADGKVWQVCDITDPLLKELLDHASVRPECDINSGWYHGGLWAKVKAVMRTKLVAIQFGRRLRREDFRSTLECGDMTPTRTTSNTFHLPLPDLQLTEEELTILRGGRGPPKKKSRVYNVRLRDAANTSALEPSEQSFPLTPMEEGSIAAGEEGTQSEGEDGDENDDGDEEDTDVNDEDDEESNNNDHGHGTGVHLTGEYGGHEYHQDEEDYEIDYEIDYDIDMDMDMDMGTGTGTGTVYPELD